MFIFTLTGEATEFFFQAVKDAEEAIKRKLTEEERTEILIEMANMGYIQAVSETNRTKDEFIRDTVKNFGNILHLKEDGTVEHLRKEDEKSGD